MRTALPVTLSNPALTRPNNGTTLQFPVQVANFITAEGLGALCPLDTLVTFPKKLISACW